MEAQSHMISDGLFVVQSGNGTLQFPVDQVEAITALPVIAKLPSSKFISSSNQAAIEQVASRNEILTQAALQAGLEPEFLRSVAFVESGLQRDAISAKGAVGLMQLMPTTAGQLGVNPWQVEQNAIGGAAFLRKLLIRYNGNSALALAAYNAGPGAVDKYKGVPPFPETRRYVIKVLDEYARQQRVGVEKGLLADEVKTAATTGSSVGEALRAQATRARADRSVLQ